MVRVRPGLKPVVERRRTAALLERRYAEPWYAASEEVATFCCAYEDRLSPLTRREALKVMARRAANRGA